MPDLIPTDVLFTGIRSYAQLHPRTISSVSLALEADIKPAKERGLLMFAQTPHFYTALSLQGGLLEYRWTGKFNAVCCCLSFREAKYWHATSFNSNIYIFCSQGYYYEYKHSAWVAWNPKLWSGESTYLDLVYEITEFSGWKQINSNRSCASHKYWLDLVLQIDKLEVVESVRQTRRVASSHNKVIGAAQCAQYSCTHSFVK